MPGLSIIICAEKGGNVSVSMSNESKTNVARPYKGKNARKYVSDYCLFDLETTGVCQAEIIEISAIKVRNNNVVDEFSTLINPRCHIPEEATRINHITDDMVKDAPTLDEVIDQFLAFVGNDLVVGYNNSSFDVNYIYDAALSLRNIHFSNDYVDVYHAARRSVKELENYKLSTLCECFGVTNTDAHRALSDCYATKACYDFLYAKYGDSAFAPSSDCYCSEPHYSIDTICLRELKEMLSGFLSDGILSNEEIDTVRQWEKSHKYLSDRYPFKQIIETLDKAFEDGVISDDETNEIKQIFSEIIDPVKSQHCNQSICTLMEKHVCLTGEFDYGQKRDVESIIISHGGSIDESVKKTTDYLVVGAKGSEAWKAGNYGGKIQKAMEYQKKGSNITIIEEANFMDMVNAMEVIDEENVQTGVAAASSACWKSAIQNSLTEIEKEQNLPQNSLCLITNYGQDKSKITSYSVCICEPDSPFSKSSADSSKSSVILNIKESSDKLELLVAKDKYKAINAPEDAEIKELQSDNINMHVLYAANSSSLTKYVENCTKYAIATYVSKASPFGCCGKFEECSDAKRCLHENQLYSKACAYRKNLEAGNIFYGKNRNID